MHKTPATLDELHEQHNGKNLLVLADVRQAALDATAARDELERIMARADGLGISRRAIASAAGFSPAGVGKILRRKG